MSLRNGDTVSDDFKAEYNYLIHSIGFSIRYTLDVEAVSCDEMYVNLTDVLNDTKLSVEEFVSHIRNEITEKTGCPCSAGIGANK